MSEARNKSHRYSSKAHHVRLTKADLTKPLILDSGLARILAGVGGGAAPAIPTIASSVYWLDATDASTISATSGSVSEIRDRLGGTTKLAQGEGSLQPTTGAATINGLNAIDFTGDDKALFNNPDFMPGSSSSFVFVIRSTDTSSILLTGGGGNRAVGVIQSGASTATHVNAGSPSTFIGGVPLSPATRGALYTGTTGATSIVVVRGANTNVGGEDWTEIRLCDYAGPAVFDYTGLIGEFVAMNAPTTSELNALGAYLGTKWGASWTDIT
jgi:hypothetical protein